MLKIMFIVIGSVVAIGGLGFFAVTFGMSEIKNYSIEDIDLSTIPDGEYMGKHSKGRWNCEVKVIVKDGKIADIDIIKALKPDDEKMSFNDAIKSKILSEQKIAIDTVSGASVHSKAFLKAVENALKSK